MTMPHTAAPPQTPSPAAKDTLFGAPAGQDARVLAARARDLARDDKILIHIALDALDCLLMR